MADNEATSPAAVRRRAWILVGAIALAIVVLIALAFLFAPRDDDDDAAPSPTPPDTSSATPSETASSPSPSTPSPTPSSAPSPSGTSGPGPGSPFPELDPVGPTEVSQADRADVALTLIEAVDADPGPGEVAGAAIRVTVTVTNTSDEALDLNLVVVNAYMVRHATPAETFERPGGVPFEGALDPGDSVDGVFLFRIPEERRAGVTIVVDYLPGTPAAVFEGDVP